MGNTHDQQCIAITGTRGFLGDLLLRALGRRARPPRLVAIDHTQPDIEGLSYHFVECDLTAPNADQILTDAFRMYGCDTVVHAAVHSQPKHHQEYSHELQSIGTWYLLHAAKAAGVRKVVMSSTTEVYGAFPDNPSFLTEEHPLRGKRLSSYLRDKVEIENSAALFARKVPHAIVTVLRPCTILGPRIRNYKTHILKRDPIVTALGFDPLVQFIHEDDAVAAFERAIDHDVAGVFNIVGHDVAPLSHALAMIGKTRCPLPGALLRSMTSLLWNFDIHNIPPSHVDFLQYACIADGRKAKMELGFTPRYALADVLRSFQEGQGGAQ